jgi:hypothetical protein
MATTNHYGLKKIGSGESIADDSFKFSDADRDAIDLLLYEGTEGHHHTGGDSDTETPTTAPGLALVTTSGALPAGRRVWYSYSLVAPSGAETGGSPTAFIDTPVQVASPAAATAIFQTDGGTLAPGGYYYVLSAYTASSTFETPAINPVFLQVGSATATNVITLTLPALPAGASGFNVFRQAPGGPGYFWIASVDMTAATPPSGFEDTGLPPNCDRTRPTVNTTLSTNSVTVTLPFTLTVGQQWRIYRTYDVEDWTNSMLDTVETSPFVDVGGATFSGQPPSHSVSVGSPSKVLLTDRAEIQGRAPLSAVSAFPHVVTFSLEGPVYALFGTSTWLCEFPQATIVGVRALLGAGYTPAQDDVVVDVNVNGTSIFEEEEDQPIIQPGDQVGTKVVPTDITELVEGDLITVDVDQAGGGASPTDHELTVQIALLVYGYTSATSHPWATP